MRIENAISTMRFTITKETGKDGICYRKQTDRKGEFASQIYSEEILIGEIFATEFYKIK